MELLSPPDSLRCSVCDEAIENAGYLPVTEREAGYEPLADAAVCDACGFNSIGMVGCAPELDDVVEPGSADRLLYVAMTGDGIDVLSEKA